MRHLVRWVGALPYPGYPSLILNLPTAIFMSLCQWVCLPPYYSLYFIPSISTYVMQFLTLLFLLLLSLLYPHWLIIPPPSFSLPLSLLPCLCHSCVLLLLHLFLLPYTPPLYNVTTSSPSLNALPWPLSPSLSIPPFHPSFHSLSPSPLSLCPLLYSTSTSACGGQRSESR